MAVLLSKQQGSSSTVSQATGDAHTSSSFRSTAGSSFSVATKERSRGRRRRHSRQAIHSAFSNNFQDNSFGRRSSSVVSNSEGSEFSDNESDASVENDFEDLSSINQSNQKLFSRFFVAAKSIGLKLQVSVGFIWSAIVFATCLIIVLVLYYASVTRISSYIQLSLDTSAQHVSDKIYGAAFLLESALFSVANTIEFNLHPDTSPDITKTFLHKELRVHKWSENSDSLANSLFVTEKNRSAYGISILPNGTTLYYGQNLAFTSIDILNTTLDYINPVFNNTKVLRPILSENVFFDSIPSKKSDSRVLVWRNAAIWESYPVYSLSTPMYDVFENFYGVLTTLYPFTLAKKALVDQQQNLRGLEGVQFILFDSESNIVAETISDNSLDNCYRRDCYTAGPVQDFFDIAFKIFSGSIVSQVEHADANQTHLGYYSAVLANKINYNVAWKNIDPFQNEHKMTMVAFVPSQTVTTMSIKENLVTIVIAVIICVLGVFISYPSIFTIVAPVNSISEYIKFLFVRYEAGLNGKLEEKDYKLLTATRLRLKARTSRVSEIRALQTLFLNTRKLLTVFNRYLPLKVAFRLMQNQTGGTKLFIERKHVAVLLIELFQFEIFMASPSCTAESCAQIQNHYFNIIMSSIADCDGSIIEITESELICVFECSDCKEKAVIAACKCAIKIQEECEFHKGELLSKGLPKFKVNVIINYGSSFLGNFGSKNIMKFGVIGELTVLAKSIAMLSTLFDVKILCTDPVATIAKEGDFTVCPIVKVVADKKHSPVIINQLLVNSSPENLARVEEYRHIYAAFYSTSTDWKVQENITRLDSTISTYLKSWPGDWGATNFKKRVFAREIARPNLMSKLKSSVV